MSALHAPHEASQGSNWCRCRVGIGNSVKHRPLNRHRHFREDGWIYEDGGNSSEHEFQPKLNLARSSGCAHDFARRGTDRAAGKDVRVRKTEIGSVGDIKKFGPK